VVVATLAGGKSLKTKAVLSIRADRAFGRSPATGHGTRHVFGVVVVVVDEPSAVRHSLS